MFRPLALAAMLLAVTPPALAGEKKALPVDATPPASADGIAAAKQVVADYLAKVQAKKWGDAKALVHPKRLAELASELARTGEAPPLAAWARVKESYLVRFTLVEAKASGHGTVVVAAKLDDYSVEDQGEEDGVDAEFLVTPLSGKWLILDERLGTNEFPAATIGLSYKGYFDGEYVPPPPQKPKPRHGRRR